MKKISWFVLFFVVLVACTSLPYRDDVGFLVSAQANSPEFPVYINGHLCTDMEGSQGLCSKRIKSTEDITFKFDPQNYAYHLNVKCSNGVTPVPPVDVLAKQSFSFTIKSQDFSQMLEFICQGEVEPQDRTQPISAKFSVHIVVYDARYTSREKIYVTNVKGANVLVLGQFARDSWVFDNGQWSHHTKLTTVKLKGDPSKVKAYSESLAMRYNTYNLSDADSGVIHE